ncbi:MAG: LicD family protein [Clostridia bacterium]|nr:LicD family protein [Clostridia bacterium]
MRELSDEERKYVHEKCLILLKAFKEVCDKENIWYSLAYGTLLGAVREKGFIPWDTDADVYIFLPDKERFRAAFQKHKPKGIKLNNYNTAKKCLQSHDMLLFEEKMDIDDIHIDIEPLVGAPSMPKKQKKFCTYTKYCDKIIRSKYVDIKQCKKKNKILVFFAKIFDFFIPDKVLKRNILKRETKYDFYSSTFYTTLVNYGRISDCLPKDYFSNRVEVDFEGEKFQVIQKWDEYLKRIYGDYMTPVKY